MTNPDFDIVIRGGTIVSGQVTYRDGESTGALPGRLVRGARQATNCA